MREKALRKTADDDISALRRWWSNKYTRPGNDPELLSLTPAGLLALFYEDLHDRRSELKSRVRSGDGDRKKLEEALAVVEEILEVRGSLEDWQDEVEKALAEGAMPSWAAGLEDSE